MSREQVRMSPGWRDQVSNADDKRGGKSFYPPHPLAAVGASYKSPL